ncbi:ferredoxin-fold anticodon-binding domain-containing protein 1-like [Montipora foliosa]|uniref:ferredoxin-fold anticodon-binding domain-containing protein 1-like n=1 Tax=Montipora foliosa TaxID=591990 RepID=UPI0035F1F1B3
MALLDPTSYSENVLVVGDGNFSFTLCLASALSNTSVKIIATSLDSRSELEENDFAVKNIGKLSAYENVEILHEVDATDLSKTFGPRVFDRVIFNFPHLGGKSNIGKSRKLLDRFFASAAKHVEPFKGDVCVSLCQGQGGTPLDNPRRELGNTWQVVYQAAKSGLILHAVYPFTSTDYHYYRSAGFRGQLGKGFHTINGLTHLFVHGVSLVTVPDKESSVCHKTAQQRYPMQSPMVVPHNPVYIITNKLKHFFSDIVVDGRQVFSEFKEFNNAMPYVDQCGLTHIRRDDDSSFLGKALEHLRESVCSFVMSGTEINFFFPPSSQNHPIRHKLIAAQTVMDAANTPNVMSCLKTVIDLFIKDVCCNLDGLRIEANCTSTLSAYSGPDLTSETIELKCGRQTKFRSLTCAARSNIGCECGKTSAREKCVFCRLERKYLGYDSPPQVCMNDLCQLSTRTELFHGQRLILSCGVLDTKSVFSKSSQQNLVGWLMELNLDHLAMALFGIRDIRLLWSDDERFKKQFADLQGRALQNYKEFEAFSIFPPSYVHDISFWITEHMTEQQFFHDICETTQGCVCDVQFIERYHNTDQDKVSYNYRMVYSSSDKPLSHYQTVKMQNLLRRKLLSCDFHLK